MYVSNWSDVYVVISLANHGVTLEKNETIGMAPAQLLFENPIHLDRGILLPNFPTTRTCVINDKVFMLSAWAVQKSEGFAGYRPIATTSS